MTLAEIIKWRKETPLADARDSFISRLDWLINKLTRERARRRKVEAALQDLLDCYTGPETDKEVIEARRVLG